MKSITVAYASDNNYVMPTIVSITSILSNKHKDTFCHIYILDNRISEENKKKFFWKQYENEYEMRFFSINLRELEEWNGNGNWPITTFGRFFVCDLLIEQEKCIYLDSDTLILEDLYELYSVDLTDKYLAGVKSPGTNYNVAANKHSCLSKERDKYFLKCVNAGVLVMNLKLLRDMGGGLYFQKKTFEISADLKEGQVVTDQDILNMLFIDKIEYLPLKYNFYLNNISNFYSRHYYPFCFTRKVIEEAFLDPVIIHYALPEKPWNYSNAERVYAWPYRKYRKIWDAYYNISPLKTEKLFRRRLSFTRIFLMNFLKPTLKQIVFLLKIKRKLCHTPVDSPIHDFFD
jgi:lipopolysaccharide biosynthesis glycosyltransferase